MKPHNRAADLRLPLPAVLSHRGSTLPTDRASLLAMPSTMPQLRPLARVGILVAASLLVLACITPPSAKPATASSATATNPPKGAPPLETASDLDAWTAGKAMGIGINIGNTLENTTEWETGWGQPFITKAYIDALADLGFETVRLPVAWDTYAVKGRISPSKLTMSWDGRQLHRLAFCRCFLRWLCGSWHERIPSRRHAPRTSWWSMIVSDY
jgi:hypothetical protein